MDWPEGVAWGCYVEEVVRAAWRERFSEDGDDFSRDFFAMGGDSLDAVVMLSEILDRLDVDVDFGSFFDDLSVPAIVEILAAADPSA